MARQRSVQQYRVDTARYNQRDLVVRPQAPPGGGGGGSLHSVLTDAMRHSQMYDPSLVDHGCNFPPNHQQTNPNYLTKSGLFLVYASPDRIGLSNGGDLTTVPDNTP